MPGHPLALALRRAAGFDRSAVSLRAGLVAALPVAGVLAAGTLAGDKVAAVTMGAGAMLVGIAWRAGGGLPPVATMVTDAAALDVGLATELDEMVDAANTVGGVLGLALDVASVALDVASAETGPGSRESATGRFRRGGDP